MSRVGGANVVADVKLAANDPDALVRLGAAEAASNLLPEQRPDAIGLLLTDDARAVRVASVTALGGTPIA